MYALISTIGAAIIISDRADSTYMVLADQREHAEIDKLFIYVPSIKYKYC